MIAGLGSLLAGNLGHESKTLFKCYDNDYWKKQPDTPLNKPLESK